MGLLSTEVLGGLSSTISGYDVLDVASVKEFSKIIRKIIPEKLEEKYVRLEILIGRYRDIVREMESNNKSFNLLRANKILTAPIFISDNILDIFSFNIKNKKNTIQDNNMLSEAFMIMSKLLNSKIEDSYSVDKTVSSIEKMREFKPKNITVGSLISNSARNLERLELEEKKKKSI